MPIIPWISPGREQKKAEDARSHNTAEENKLLDLALARFQNARSAKTDFDNRDLHSKWKEMDKLYRGNQWKETPPSYKSMPVVNFTFGLVESVVSRITDNRPSILVLPKRDAKNVNLAKMLGSNQLYLWDFNHMYKQVPDAARMCMKYGTVLFKGVWDQRQYDGLGEVVYSTVHPMNFFNDPRAYEVEDMDFCLVQMPKTLEYCMRRWPDKGWLIAADQDWTESEQVEGADSGSEEQVATLYEYWFKDKEGHVCVMYFTRDVVLQVIGGKYDGTNEPVYRHNRFPFAKCVDYPADKHFWGIGEVELIILLQRLINDFEAQIVDNTRLLANGQYVVNKLLSGLREEDAWLFDNRPGNIIWTHNGGVEQLPGMPIPAHVPQHQERLIYAMEQILGIHDVVQGRAPSGVRAASAIIALQESANIRVRSKAAQLEYALKEIVDQGNWLTLEYYDAPRQVRITGTSEIVTLDVRKALASRMAEMGVAAGILPPGTTGEAFTEEQVQQVFQEVKFPEFDAEVHIGPSVPYSQALLYEQAKEFYQLGIVDRQATLEATNFPNKEAILQRMEGRTAVVGEERVGERTFAGPTQT